MGKPAENFSLLEIGLNYGKDFRQVGNFDVGRSSPTHSSAKVRFD
jgi:hypothetical protein